MDDLVIVWVCFLMFILWILICMIWYDGEYFRWKCESYQWKVIDSVCIKDNKVLFYNK